MNKPVFLIVDGSYFLYRTFFGSDLSYSYTGIPNNAIRTSLSTIRRLLETIEPSRMAVVFDHPARTFRHEASVLYKSHRNPPPEDLIKQLPYFMDAVAALGITVVQHPGVEGDDAIGTIAKNAEADGYFVIISTGDKDMTQLVNENIYVENGFSGLCFDPDTVLAKFGVRPDQIPDYLALTGDKADGIAGVPGIGSKIAAGLLSRYDNIDNLIDNLNVIPGAVSRQINDSLENLALDRFLTKIKTDVDLGLNTEDFRIEPHDQESIDSVTESIGFVYGYRLLSLVNTLATVGEYNEC